jgi:CheY-like chemotaxis protein
MNKPFKILLVDDDHIFLTLAKINIEKVMPEATIYTAANGEEAMAFLLIQEVDIIFLDLNMPIMDGWELLEELSNHDKTNQKIFVVTSSIDPSDKRKAEENPLVTSMVEKPLDREKLTLAMGI